jgi:hypothetical protein
MSNYEFRHSAGSFSFVLMRARLSWQKKTISKLLSPLTGQIKPDQIRMFRSSTSMSLKDFSPEALISANSWRWDKKVGEWKHGKRHRGKEKRNFGYKSRVWATLSMFFGKNKHWGSCFAQLNLYFLAFCNRLVAAISNFTERNSAQPAAGTFKEFSTERLTSFFVNKSEFTVS